MTSPEYAIGYSLVDKITASNGPVIFYYDDIQTDHTIFSERELSLVS